ncbi:MAG: hypothetical protein LN568_04165 [Rickettsia endosymbiont of Pseudomimeciton antennatum]|nr:hypothetical protein [Rickettsia endosymbiont of Pseudomimeciton antennatum]
MERLTLDTHILIWYTEGINLSKEQVKIIEQVRQANSLIKKMPIIILLSIMQT